MSSALLTPRGGPPALTDLRARSAVAGAQRVGRRRHRRRRRRARRLRTLGLVAAALAVLAGAGAAWRWLVTSPRFVIETVEVRGASRVPPARIADAAGIAPGTSLWAVDRQQALARVTAMPEIRRADLIRELPNRVTILVEERRPFTLVHAGRLHWLDEEGRVLGEETHAAATEVPVISGLSEEELVTMRTAPGPRARTAIALIRALLRSGGRLAAEISEIDVSRPEGPVLYTVDGVEVRLGPDDWEARLARLAGVLGQVATQDVGLVDLRFKDQVVLGRGAPR